MGGSAADYSSSSQFNNYYRSSSAAEGRSSSRKRRQNKAKRVALKQQIISIAMLIVPIGMVLVTIVLVLGLYAAFHITDRDIRIDTIGGPVSDEMPLQYKQAVSSSINKGFWRDVYPFVHESDIAAELMQQYPEVASLSMVSRRSGLGVGLQVTVVIRRPSAIWHSGGVEYIVDDLGIAYAKNVGGIQSDVLPFVFDEVNGVGELGDQAGSQEVVAFIRELYAFDQQNQAYAVKEYALPLTPREVHLRFNEYGFIAKLHTDRSARAQVQALDDTLAFLRGQGVTPAEYIDLRTESKAVYK